MATAHKIGTVIFKIAVILLFLWLLAFTFGCSTKKKLTQKSKFETEIVQKEIVKEVTETETVKETTTNTKTETLTTNENDVVNVEIDDPDKDFELHKETKDGKTTYTGRNIKNLNVANEKATQYIKDTIAASEFINETESTAKDSETNTEAKASGSETNINKEKTNGIPWWLIAIAVLYGVVSIVRQSLNPIKWL